MMDRPEPFQFEDSGDGLEHAMPLMDVILLILFFFLTTSTYSENTGKMDLNLPSSSRTNPTQSQVNRVALKTNGEIVFQGKPVNRDQLKSKFQNVSKGDLLLISAESKVSHDRLVAVMESARAAGISDVGIEVQRE